MPTTYIVPVSPSINQSFFVTLSSFRIEMTLTWRNRGGAGWVMDLAAEDGTELLRGVNLVVGTDLLGQHRHLGIPGQILVVPSQGDDVPTFDNLGTDVLLAYVTNP